MIQGSKMTNTTENIPKSELSCIGVILSLIVIGISLLIGIGCPWFASWGWAHNCPTGRMAVVIYVFGLILFQLVISFPLTIIAITRAATPRKLKLLTPLVLTLSVVDNIAVFLILVVDLMS